MKDKEILKDKIITVLKTVYDPEIPVNIYDLGLIYNIEIEDKKLRITMTLTSPNCPMAEQMIDEMKTNLGYIKEIDKVEPAWNPESLSDEVKLQLGLL
jgi:metal-sulfur cluster biosynthetic enzyme